MAAMIAERADMLSPQGFHGPLAEPNHPKTKAIECFPGTYESTAIVHGQGIDLNSPRGGHAYRGRGSNMPGQTSPQSLLASLPSFMSVFGDGEDSQGTAVQEVATKNRLKRPANCYVKQHSQNSSVSSQLFRRDSASTFESTESSPTTTISTMDSALTEPSPSSSPESPTSTLPISTFKSLSTNTISTSKASSPSDSPVSPFPTLPGLNRANSPNKKMRNMKNLSVNTSTSTRQIPQLPKLSLRTDSTPVDNHPYSAPPTPSFIRPPKPPRKRPSNLGLSITTPESNASGQSSDNTIQALPPTPAEPQQRTLRYLQTASTMPLISSPTVAPEGGMRLPPFGNASIASRLSKARPPLSISQRCSYEAQSSPIRAQTLEHVQEEPDYDLPLSREAKSPAYPQGPICIYDPHVYLYLEPSDIEASEFDVVLNVAREVRNPFTVAEEKASRFDQDAMVKVSLDLSNGSVVNRDSISEPQTAVSEKSFAFGFESQMEEGPKSVPSTPKALKPQPEYIHIPWDHNTNVVDDLMRLCELIDKRVAAGKRVLVHCQCGVSRSASLVVAYGLYKNPQLSVQEAYDAVKGRSKWIGPNMNLIYQLNEFRGKLSRTATFGTTNWHSWKSFGSGRSNPNNVHGPESRSSRPPSSHPETQPEPLSAPYRKDQDSTPIRANSFSPPGSAQVVETSGSGAISPGPSSAPPDMQWSPSDVAMEDQVNSPQEQEPDPKSEAQTGAPAVTEEDTDYNPPGTAKETSTPSEPSHSPFPSLPAGFSTIASRRALHRALPFRNELPTLPSFHPIRPSDFTQKTSTLVDDIPQSPSLLSPRAAEFTASPFHRTAAGDLAGSSVFEQALMSPKALPPPSQPHLGLQSEGREEDPRSPVQKGEAPITRSIFDVL